MRWIVFLAFGAIALALVMPLAIRAGRWASKEAKKIWKEK